MNEDPPSGPVADTAGEGNPPDLSAKAVSRVNQEWNGPRAEDPHAEDRLVEAARTDRQAFAVLYDRYVDIIYHYIARRVGDTLVAEDLTSAVWERALAAIERYEIRGLPFAAWLYRIAGNLVANHYRRQRLRRLVGFEEQVVTRDARGQADDRAVVEQAMAGLSTADQEVLGLCYYAGLAPPEIAEVLGCAPAAVHKRLHRARERLRRQIEGESSVSATRA